MKKIGEAELHRANYYGIKALLRGFLLLPFINAMIVAGIKPFVKRFPVLARFPVRNSTVYYQMLSGIKVALFDTSRCEFAKEVFWGEGVLLRTPDIILLHTLERLAEKADIFVDVGSYTGIFSLIATKSSSHLKAYGFEIMPDNFLLFWKNIILNDVVDRCYIRLLGIGRQVGRMDMPISYSASILPSSLSLASKFSDGVSVPISTLDREVRYGNGQRVLVKIDVEGFELEVLEGGTLFFENFRPDILCELLPGSVSTTRIFKWCAQRNYNCYLFSHHGLELMTSPECSIKYKDWLFTQKNSKQLESLLVGVVKVIADGKQ